MFDHSISNGRAGGHPFDHIGSKLIKDPDHRGRVRMALEVWLDDRNQPKLDSESACQLFLTRMRDNFPDIGAKSINAYHLRKGWAEYMLEVWLGRFVITKPVPDITLRDLKEPLREFNASGSAIVCVESALRFNEFPDVPAIESQLTAILSGNGRGGVEVRYQELVCRKGFQRVTLRLYPPSEPELEMSP